MKVPEMNLYLLVLFWSMLAVFAASNLLYPIFFAICGLLFRKKSLGASELAEFKPITLLVPAYNESAVIKAKLINADTLEYPPGMLQVVVASDGSSDGTQEIVRSHVGKWPLKLLDFQERRGKASVVNDAIALCEDPWICLCDANVMFRPEALIQLGKRLSEAKTGAVT
ncbi:MAG: glycosyltransferase, partial [Pirellula sp.]